MSLAHAILGLLQVEPMTGYDLKTQCFDTSIRYFWPADQAQIYRTLDKMVADGWAESTIEYQQDRPNRKVYTLTQAGRAELANWLAGEHPPLIYRDPFLVQIFFAGQLSNRQIVDLLTGRMKKHQALLNEYRTVPLPPLEQLREDRESTMQRLTLEFGFAFQQMYIDWLNLAIETVQNLPDNA